MRRTLLAPDKSSGAIGVDFNSTVCVTVGREKLS